MNTKTQIFDTNLILGKPGTHPWGVESIQELLAALHANGVSGGFVTHIAGSVHDPEVGNNLLFEAMEKAPRKETPLFGIPVVRLSALPTEKIWQSWKNRKVPGVRLCPAFYKDTASKVSPGPLREYLIQFRMFLQISLTPYYGSPWKSAAISDTAFFASAIYPVPVVLTGISRGNYTDVTVLLKEHKNLFLDTGNLTTSTGIKNLVDHGWEHKLLCGSGFGISYLRQYPDVVMTSGISARAKEMVLSKNARELIENMGPYAGGSL
jgi:hypothetical protein